MGRVCCIERLREHRTCMHQTKFRSQPSDNTERCKAEMGRVREEKRRRKKKKEDHRERKSQKTEDPGARKR